MKSHIFAKFSSFHVYANEKQILFLMYRNAVLQIYLLDERNSLCISNVMSFSVKFLKEREMLLRQPWHVQFMYDIIPRNTQHTAFSHLKTHENLANNVYVHFPLYRLFSFKCVFMNNAMIHIKHASFCILNVNITLLKILIQQSFYHFTTIWYYMTHPQNCILQFQIVFKWR